MQLVVEGIAAEKQPPIELEVGRKLRIGRDPRCEVHLDSPYVSSQHAELEWDEGRPKLRAGDGLNGIYVNDRLLRESQTQVLRPGDEISLPPGFLLRVTGRSLAKGRPDHYLQLAREYSEIKSDLHVALLEKVDLRSLTQQNLPEEERRARLRETLNMILAARRLALSEDLEDFVIVEALRLGLLDRLVLQKRGAEGLAASLEEVLESDPNKDVFDRQIESCAQELRLDDPTRGVREKTDQVSTELWDLYRARRERMSVRFRDYVVKRQLRRDLEDLVFGYGPLEDLLKLPGINEVMVVDKDHIFAETNNRLEETGRNFPKNEDVEVVIGRIVSPIGRAVNRSDPIVDARLPNGSRVHIVVPPVALKGASITIRRFPDEPFTPANLVSEQWQTLSHQGLTFLRACTVGRKNMIISGGTGTGKTTLLNILGSMIPADERIVVIEDSAELQLRQHNLVNLEARKANVEGEGEITIRDLVRASLRMRPDRVVVGECRGKEALDMLQAMNTGHDGSMTTAHANTPREMISRLEVMVLEAGTSLPVQAIHRQIAGALDIIVQIQRQRDRKRRVTHITEIVGYDPDEQELVLEDIFRLVERRRQRPRLEFTGFLPTFIETLVDRGDLTLEELFGHV